MQVKFVLIIFVKHLGAPWTIYDLFGYTGQIVILHVYNREFAFALRTLYFIVISVFPKSHVLR